MIRFRFIKAFFLIYSRTTPWLLGAGVFIITAGTSWIALLSRNTTLTVNQELNNYWRTEYDILVRPAGSQSNIEEAYDLVESNFLSNTPGGISFAQYETILSIPGVEIAAPLASLTQYIPSLVPNDPRVSVRVPNDPGVYFLENTTVFYEGIGEQQERTVQYFFNGQLPAGQYQDNSIIDDGIWVNHNGAFVGGRRVSLPLAAIDPAQEAALIGLDKAVVEGVYLSGNEPLVITINSSRGVAVPEVANLPVLMSASLFTKFTETHRLGHVQLPENVNSLEDILELGGTKYLDGLPTDLIFEEAIDSDTAYVELIDTLMSGGTRIGSFPPLSITGRDYEEISPPFPYSGIVLTAASQREQKEFPAIFTPWVVGVYDVAQIPRQGDVNQVPQDTYFPPTAVLQYNGEGQKVSPLEFFPSPERDSYYIPSPPLLLTSISAIREILGEDATVISAIRIRVSGVTELTDSAQRKIEAVANEVAQQTGLAVDVMVGSSPTKVLVLVDGAGYVEEQWVQKHITTTYKERIQSGHLLFIGTLIGIGVLFTLDLTWSQIISGRKIIALQKALGWRSTTVFMSVFGGTVLVTVVGSLLGILMIFVIAKAYYGGVQVPISLFSLPAIAIVLVLIGGIYPAWVATEVSPVSGLRQDGIRFETRGSRGVLTGVVSYAWRGLLRRSGRTVLGGLTAMLSSTLLVIILTITMDRQRLMTGTLLGEFILVRIEPFHYAIILAGYIFAFMSLLNSQLTSALERRREIGIVKAIGWRTNMIVKTFVSEGAIIGFVGGIVGVLVGIGVLTTLYRTVTVTMVWIGMFGILFPVLVGIMAAAYPAYVASQMQPAKLVRYE